MSVSLSKGQKVSLEKSGGGGIAKLHMGLGWDPAEQQSAGFFAKLLGGGSRSIDLDASCIVCAADGSSIDLVWFKQLKSADGSIIHTGDNTTGEGDGDDESIKVDTAKLPANAAHLVFTVNSYQGQTFNEVDNAFCRILDDGTHSEICRYTLTEQGPHTGVVMGVLSRDGSGWSFTALGTPANGQSARDMSAAAAAAIAAVQ
ncbi:MAG: TerD family protein [Granulosicoccus sp.]